MVVGLVELEMVVLVVDDRLAAIARRGAPIRDLQPDTVRAGLRRAQGAVDAVAVRQQEVGRGEDGGRRRLEAERAGADQEPPLAPLFRYVRQLVAARSGDDRMG